MSRTSLQSLRIQPQLFGLHERVQRQVTQLTEAHGKRLTCHRGCKACCVDNLTVFEVEAEQIQDKHHDLLTTGTAGAPGQCAFLDEHGACRIYNERPYVCRTQGLPLRWLDEEVGPDGEREPVEYRDICELNLAGPSLHVLPEAACWPIGPIEDELQKLQAESTPQTSLRRVSLRELFGHREADSNGP